MFDDSFFNKNFSVAVSYVRSRNRGQGGERAHLNIHSIIDTCALV